MRILRAGLVSLMVVVIASGMVVGLTEPRIGDAFRRAVARQPHKSRKAAAGTRAVAPRVALL